MSFFDNPHPPQSTANTLPSDTQPGDDVISRLCIAIVVYNESTNQPNMRLLTPAKERLPVPLKNLRSFPEIRRTLRLILLSTMSHHGLQSTQMTHAGAILPTSRFAARNGLLGITDQQNMWQNFINTIANLFHPPCNQPETCSQCREPALIVACFPFDAWNANPGVSITLRDRYNGEHGLTLRRLSAIEDQRYFRIIERQSNRQSGSSVTFQNLNSSSVPSLSSQSSTSSGIPSHNDPTKGPKGRTLMGTNNSDNRKPKDFSKATLRPANAEQGIKAESDTCLTCIQYGKICTGTTMTLVPSSRKSRSAQWKCERCQVPQRRCLWRPSMSQDTTYGEAFKADGGKACEKNTVEGRRARAEERRNQGGDADEDEDEDGDEDHDEAGDHDEE